MARIVNELVSNTDNLYSGFNMNKHFAISYSIFYFFYF